MKKIIESIVVLVLVIMTYSCSKDEVEFKATPEIEFVSISPSAVKEFQDEVSITIKYRDGDGDLGENIADVKNLFVTDNRNNVEYSFRIPELTPSGSEIAIEGNLEIDMNSLSVVGSGNSEQVIFSVYLVDRSGNVSNVIATSAITVSK